MKKLILLLFIALLLSAGCISAYPEKPAVSGLSLMPMSDPFPILGGQGYYSYIIANDSSLSPLNYSMGYVIIPPGNGTPPHRLIGTSELLYVIEGTARIQCDNETITVSEGELTLLPEGALQSITASGDTELCYLSVNQPPYSSEIDISGDDPAALAVTTDGVPIIVRDPAKGIEWDYNTGTLIYTLINPVLMPEKSIPIDYSVAYAEILPGGHIVKNRLAGLTELVYVIEREIVISSPEAGVLRVPAGSAGLVPVDMVKDFENPGGESAKILSFVDPAWRMERAHILG